MSQTIEPQTATTQNVTPDKAAKYTPTGEPSGGTNGGKAKSTTKTVVKSTNELAKFVIDTAYENLPNHLVDHLRRLLLDNIGNSSYAAQFVESSPSVRAALHRLDSQGGPATVVGDSGGYSYLFAALLNGLHAHSMDCDDTSIQMVGHPGAAVISAAFAESERTDVLGKDFFEAVAVGYEVECRLGEAITVEGYSRGFHITGVAGIFGAVATLAKLRKYTAETLECAWGLALSKAAGSMQYLENGSWNKRLHPGFAAHDALLVTALAEAGAIGATSAFEGQYGLLHAYSPNPKPEEITDRLGSEWLTMNTGIKPYPCCRLTHAAIDLALKSRGQVPDADRPKAKLTIEINSTANQLVGGTEDFKKSPRSTVDAQFSIYFVVAAGWVNGAVDWDSYSRLQDPTLLGVTKNMVVKVNNDLPDGAAILTVQIGDKPLTDRLDTPTGEPSNWMGDDALKAKFLKEAGRVFGVERAKEILDTVLALDQDGPLAELVRMTRIHKS